MEDTARAIVTPAPLQEAFVRSSANAERKTFAPMGDDGFSFQAVLDIINPLQHIPIISSIYRKVTGDTIGALPRVAGGALFGGPIGALTSVLNVIIEEASGKDVGDHALALFSDDDKPPEDTGESWAMGGMNPLPVESEQLAPPPLPFALDDGEGPNEDLVPLWGFQTAGAGNDPVAEWAWREARMRGEVIAEKRNVQPPPLLAELSQNPGEDPVTAWARREREIREQTAQETPPEPQPPLQGGFGDNNVATYQTAALLAAPQLYQQAAMLTMQAQPALKRIG